MKKKNILLIAVVGVFVLIGLAKANEEESVAGKLIMTVPMTLALEDSMMPESPGPEESLYGSAAESTEIGPEIGEEMTVAREPFARGALVDGLVGKTVQNMDGEKLGKIIDVFIDNETNEIAYLIVKSTGFFGLGGEERVVPFHAVFIDDENGRVQVSMDIGKYNSAPLRQPNMSDREWGRKVHEYYGVAPYWEESWAPPRFEEDWDVPGYEAPDAIE